MKKETESKDNTLNRFKALSSIDTKEVAVGLVKAYLVNIDELQQVSDAAKKAASGQLGALKAALMSCAAPVTEPVWDADFRPNVADTLENAKKENGELRYKNRASRDVTLNMLKVATMGLTLAEHDPSFAPSDKSSGNVKKYASEVRPLLQKAIDPATGQPRLRTIEQKARPKALPKGKLYWLIGCETNEGIAGANTIIAADDNLDALRRRAQRLADKFKSYLYIEAPQNAPVLDIAAETEKPLAIQNAAVFAATF